MKKLLILLFSILLSSNSHGGLFDKTVCVDTETVERGGLIYLPNKTKPFSGKNLCTYDNGENKSKGKFKKGAKDGQWIEWHENGQIDTDITYIDNSVISQNFYNENGQLSSFQELFKDGYARVTSFRNGQMSSKAIYLNGIRDSITTYSYYENGEIEFEKNYKDDKLFNLVVYHRNGQKNEDINVENGKRNGESTSWHKNGQIMEEAIYENDIKRIKNQWYENGQKGSVRTYKNGKKDGEWSFWNFDGQKLFERNYKDGKENGRQTNWFDDGQIMKQATYKEGVCIEGDCDWNWDTLL
jgi:antitoxin component YwqK of YwqJK toxin-antitoxin module